MFILKKTVYFYIFIKLLVLTFKPIQTAFGQEQIRFIYFNDFHAQNIPVKQDEKASFSPMVGGAATFAAYIDSFKRGYEDRVCVVDAGDDFQGTPISEITKGHSQVLVLNLIKPDIMTLGNHEFDYGRKSVDYLLNNAQFPIVASNILDKQKQGRLGLKYLIKNLGTVRVGFIGLITNSMSKLTLEENIEGYVFLDTHLTVKTIIPEIQDKVDLIVLVSHCGDRADIALAKKHPEIDIILGGHTHKTLFLPKITNNVIICQAGSKGKYIGILDIWFDLNAKKILNFQSRLVNTFVDNIEPDPIVKVKVDSLENIIKEQFDQVVGVLRTPWIRGRREESNIGNWITDAMREYTKANVAFQNKNGIRKDLVVGDITIRDIWEILPFSNQLVIFQLTGDELRLVLENNVKGKPDFLLASGIRYSWKTRKKAGNRIQEVFVDGIPIENDRVYTVCTNDYLIGKNKFSDAFGFSRKGRKFTFTGKLIRDILIEKIQSEKMIASHKDGRIIQINKL